MKLFLQNIVKSLNYYSKSLSKKSIFVDKPWALVDSDLEIQKLIFKRNKELVMSKDGQVIMGKWDYFPEAKSLLIDRGQDKILCNEGFIDEGVMVLKKDGTKNDFFVFANENIVPDLDAYAYLEELKNHYLYISTKTLTDGRKLEIMLNSPQFPIRIGNRVNIDAEEIPDGIYLTEEPETKFIIKNSTIDSIVHLVTYDTKNGVKIIVEQKNQSYYLVGDKVWVHNKQAPDGKYRVIRGRNIIVKEGRIVEIKLF